MRTRTKGMIAGAIAGATVAGVLAIPAMLPPAMAQEEPARTMLKTGSELLREALDGSVFVKPPVRFNVAATVSTEVTEQRTVRKIGYGRTRMVEIYTTPSGTYSSDGLNSRHFVYPGITANPEWTAWVASTSIAYLSDGSWVAMTDRSANSFVDIIPFADGRLGIREDGSACVKVDNALYC